MGVGRRTSTKQVFWKTTRNSLFLLQLCFFPFSCFALLSKQLSCTFYPTSISFTSFFCRTLSLLCEERAVEVGRRTRTKEIFWKTTRNSHFPLQLCFFPFPRLALLFPRNYVTFCTPLSPLSVVLFLLFFYNSIFSSLPNFSSLPLFYLPSTFSFCYTITCCSHRLAVLLSFWSFAFLLSTPP